MHTHEAVVNDERQSIFALCTFSSGWVSHFLGSGKEIGKLCFPFTGALGQKAFNCWDFSDVSRTFVAVAALFLMDLKLCVCAYTHSHEGTTTRQEVAKLGRVAGTSLRLFLECTSICMRYSKCCFLCRWKRLCRWICNLAQVIKQYLLEEFCFRLQ